MPNVRTPLSPNASFWVCAAVVAHTFWTSAAPAMTYPLYAAQWHLTETTVTAIFAIYPIVVVGCLVLFGGLSEVLGSKETLLVGLGASIVGAVLFAVATGVAWLFAGRVFMGIGVGLTAGPSAAAVVAFNTTGRSSRASSVTTAAQSAGFTIALLLGGALIQYAPYPTRLGFCLLSLVLTALLVAAAFLPRGERRPQVDGRIIRPPSVPGPIRGVFVVAVAGVTTAYTHGVLMLSLGSQVARDLLGSTNAFVTAASLAPFAVLIGVVGIAGRRFAPRVAMLLGAAASAASMGLLTAAVSSRVLALFVAATAAAGVGYSLLFRGGLEMINAAAPPTQRAGVLSALFLFAYLSLGLVALGLGIVATHRGLGLAIDLGAGLIAAMSLASAVLVATSKPAMKAPMNSAGSRA